MKLVAEKCLAKSLSDLALTCVCGLPAVEAHLANNFIDVIHDSIDNYRGVITLGNDVSRKYDASGIGATDTRSLVSMFNR